MDLLSGGFVEQAPLFQGYWCVHRTGSSGIPGLFNRSERSDKMTKKIILVAAIVMAFAAQSAMADLEFGGYLRSGSGSSSKGGGNNCFRVNGESAFNTAGNSAAVDGAGRLGNQCDTYGEVKLGTTMGDSDGTKFGVHTLVAYGTSQVADYEGTIPALREAYGSAEGFGSGALAKSTVWAGKRFYKREDVHIVDLFILQDTGPGAGIENIDVGIGKFSYALMKAGAASYVDTTGATPGQEIGRVTLNGDPSQQKTDHDIRLEGINLGNAGSLGFGTNIVRGNNSAVSGNNYNGWSAWAKHSIVLFGAMQNALWVQTAHHAGNLDGSALYWAQSNSGNGTANSMQHSAWRVIDAANFDFGDKWNGAAFLGYGKESFPWFGIGGLADTARTSISLVVRPIYHFTENLGLAVEAGTVRVSGYNLNYDNNPGSTTNYLNKLTISPQLSMGSGFMARPVLRAYVSYMKWNRDTTAYGTETGASACTGRDCSVGVPGFANVSSAVTYGVQMEAWW
jgi:maltoporin